MNYRHNVYYSSKMCFKHGPAWQFRFGSVTTSAHMAWLAFQQQISQCKMCFKWNGTKPPSSDISNTAHRSGWKVSLIQVEENSLLKKISTEHFSSLIQKADSVLLQNRRGGTFFERKLKEVQLNFVFDSHMKHVSHVFHCEMRNKRRKE